MAGSLFHRHASLFAYKMMYITDHLPHSHRALHFFFLTQHLAHHDINSVENQDSGDNNSNNISAIKRMEPRRAKRFISSSPVAGLTGATSSEIPTSFLSPSGPIKKRIRVLGELDHNAVLGLPLNSNRHVDFLVTPSPRKVAAGRCVYMAGGWQSLPN